MAPTTPPVIVMSGPSGTGKSTLLNRLLAKYPDTFGFSVSHTTRQPREGEKDGEHYHFITTEKFLELIGQNAFIEHAEFAGKRYGTSFNAVKDVVAKGKVCILDIEMEGVKQVHKSDLTAKFLFIAPPNEEELEKRLRGRGTDKEEAVQKRLQQAKNELEYAKQEGVHDKVVVNDELEKAYGEVEEYIMRLVKN